MAGGVEANNIYRLECRSVITVRTVEEQLLTVSPWQYVRLLETHEITITISSSSSSSGSTSSSIH